MTELGYDVSIEVKRHIHGKRCLLSRLGTSIDSTIDYNFDISDSEEGLWMIWRTFGLDIDAVYDLLREK